MTSSEVTSGYRGDGRDGKIYKKWKRRKERMVVREGMKTGRYEMD